MRKIFEDDWAHRWCCGLVMGLASHFGEAHWGWEKSVFYGFGVVGMMATTGELGRRFRERKG